MDEQIGFSLNEMFGSQPLQITKPIRLIELFAGIGAQAKALENLCVPFEHWRISEIDKYAVQSYNAIHGTNFKPSDIRIRKLTPRECMRLMAFSDSDVDACYKAGMSNSQLYKQAGNSICVCVLEAIFGAMIPGKEDAYKEHWGGMNRL